MSGPAASPDVRQVPGLDELMAAYTRVDRRREDGRPWLLTNMVGGLDGSATIGGRVGSLSTAQDQAFFRTLRQLADVVLVGAQTVRNEGYGAVRLSDEAQAARVEEGRRAVPPLAVVSRSLDLDWGSKLFTDAPEGSRSIVVTCASADPDRVAAAREVADVVVAGDERVEPQRAIEALGAEGFAVVLCEGGPTWLGEIVAAGMADEICLSIAPVMGGDALPVAVSPPAAPVTAFALRHALTSEGTVFLRYERAAETDPL